MVNCLFIHFSLIYLLIHLLTYKLAVLIFRCLYGQAPPYLRLTYWHIVSPRARLVKIL